MLFQSIVTIKTMVDARSRSSNWMTGKQILVLVASKISIGFCKINEAETNIRKSLFDIILIQAGKRGISLDRRRAGELVDSIFVERTDSILIIPDGLYGKIDYLLENRYCNECGGLIEFEHSELECKNRVLKEIMES